MRLLIVSQYFWPENFRVNDLVSALVERGHQVTVLTGLPNYPEGRVFAEYRADPSAFSTFEGVEVIRVPMLPRGNGGLRLVLNYLSFMISASLWGPIRLRGRPFDAIFVFQPSPITSAMPAVILRRIKRAPFLLWVLDLWPETLKAIGVVTSPRLLRLVGSLVRFIYQRCDRILVQSRAFVANVAGYAGGEARVRYFPGWPENVFEGSATDDPAPELAPFADDFKLLFAGNIGEAQDFPAILDAAEILKDEPGLRWLIVGDGRAVPAVRGEIARRGLAGQVVMLGRYPLERMPSFFKAADTLLVSLRSAPIWSMTIPGKVQSYLAAGKPVIGMLDGEGARVLAESGAGMVGPAGRGDRLADNVRAMIALSPKRRRAMGMAGKAYCDREFDRATLVSIFEAWVAEVCAEPERPGRY